MRALNGGARSVQITQAASTASGTELGASVQGHATRRGQPMRDQQPRLPLSAAPFAPAATRPKACFPLSRTTHHHSQCKSNRAAYRQGTR